MNMPPNGGMKPADLELQDLFKDPELMETANLLRSVEAPAAHADPTFRAALRRDLMREAWSMAETRMPWWRRLVAPPALAWAAASVGVILIAFVAFNLGGGSNGSGTTIVASPLDTAQNVALEKPIEIDFSQPVDHRAVEASLVIEPRTRVTFDWQGNNLIVHPVDGQLAPNTQYQVTVAPKPAAGKPSAPAKTITFRTVPPPSPKPPVAPSPVPPLTAERQLAPAPANRVVGWSPDGGTLYYLSGGNQVLAVAAGGGAPRAIPADGVKLAALSPDGTQLVLLTANGISTISTDPSAKAPTPVAPGDAQAVGWQQLSTAGAARPVFVQGTTVAAGAAAAGVISPATPSPVTIATLPETATAAFLSPDGDRLAYRSASATRTVDLSNGHASTNWAQIPVGTVQWSPDGKHVLFVGADGVYEADPFGQSPVKLAGAADLGGKPGDNFDLAWSGRDQILLATPTALWAVHPDATGLHRLNARDAEFAQPVWSANGSTIAYRRGSAPWAAQVNLASIAATSSVDDGYRAVTDFMDARTGGKVDVAQTFLDSAGQAAYKAAGAPLVINGDPRLDRYFVVAAQAVPGQPAGSERFTVRLVLEHGTTDVAQYDESLVLQHDPAGGKLLVHQVTVTSQQPYGKGPEVVGVQLERNQLKVSFNSDLEPAKAGPEVLVKDSSGKVVQGVAANYANRVYTLTLPPLAVGSTYRLSVLPTVNDVGGRQITAEYDLDFVATS